MTVAPQADTEIVTGTVVGVLQKAADKWQVQVQKQRDDGSVSQYNTGLWTKDPDLVGQMLSMIGQTLSFQCGASHWNMSDGTPVRSLWVNGYGQPGQVQPAAAQPVMPQPVVPQPVAPQAPQPFVPAAPAPSEPQAPSAYEKDQRIMREAGAKVAAILLTHLEPEQRTLQNLIAISERLVAYYENGVEWGEGGDGNPGHGDGDPTPPDDADGIPF